MIWTANLFALSFIRGLGNPTSADMNKCQQSIQLVSQAFDPDFVLSDFERNKVCESEHKTSWTAGSSGMVRSCSYEFNDVVYTQEHDLDDQSLRFIISPFLGCVS